MFAPLDPDPDPQSDCGSGSGSSKPNKYGSGSETPLSKVAEWVPAAGLHSLVNFVVVQPRKRVSGYGFQFREPDNGNTDLYFQVIIVMDPQRKKRTIFRYFC